MEDNTQTNSTTPENSNHKQTIGKTTSKMDRRGHFSNSQVILDMDFLGRLIDHKFGGKYQFSKILHIDSSCVFHCLSGKQIPKRSETIRRWANALGLDPIELTQIFESARRDYDSFKLNQSSPVETIGASSIQDKSKEDINNDTNNSS